MQFHYVLLALLLLLTACAGQTPKQSTGSNQLPGFDYFLNVYHLDAANSRIQSLDEYLGWANRFYEGTELYPNGWNNVTKTLIQAIKTPELVNEVRTKMEQLGLLISAEWAKDNKTRLINTRHVSIWGNALLKSLEQGETMELIVRVSFDAENLLARRITADVITEDRFYAEEDVFDSPIN